MLDTTLPTPDIRNHPAYIAMQYRLDVHYDVLNSQDWPAGSLARLQTEQHALETADYLRHLPSESAFFVYSSPKPGFLVVHCALPLLSTEIRAVKQFANAAELQPFFTSYDNRLVFNSTIVIYWQSASNRVIPAI